MTTPIVNVSESSSARFWLPSWFVIPVPPWVRWGIYATFLVVGVWLCSRPEPRASALPLQ